MLPHLPSSLHLERFTRSQISAATATGIAVTGLLLYLVMRKRVSLEELEYQRRTLLAREGRLVDGSIVGIDGVTEESSFGDAQSEIATPRVLVYNYRIAGVTYECAQDVTTLSDYVRNLRVDLPVQVRYDPRNPGNSIIVAENWNGVRLDAPELHGMEQPHTQL